MRIAILTDSWIPQTSGVVTTLDNLQKNLVKTGHTVKVVSHLDFDFGIPLPTYPEMRMAVDLWKIDKIMDSFNPEIIHISTPEGTVGLAGRIYCSSNKLNYTTSYHTRIPEYVRSRFPIPIAFSYMYMRDVHKDSCKILVTTKSMFNELVKNEFSKDKLRIWSRGVNHEIFNPSRKNYLSSNNEPVYLFVGRVSVEKNIEEFLNLKIKGRKIIVGDGPDLKKLKTKYQNVTFTGYKRGIELAKIYASANVFVFPSYTDTFGVVLLESIACGTPIAAHDAPGPKDVIEPGINGYLSENLEESIEKCLQLNRDVVFESSKKWSWDSCCIQFLSYIVPIRED